MKQFFLLFGLLISIILFTPDKETDRNDSFMPFAQEETIMTEKTTADMRHNFEVLSNDLKESNLLTPRRAFQTTNHNPEARVFKHIEKLFRHIRLARENQLQKVSQGVSFTQTIHLSTLLCRMGQHIIVLRKLII